MVIETEFLSCAPAPSRCNALIACRSDPDADAHAAVAFR